MSLSNIVDAFQEDLKSARLGPRKPEGPFTAQVLSIEETDAPFVQKNKKLGKYGEDLPGTSIKVKYRLVPGPGAAEGEDYEFTGKPISLPEDKSGVVAAGQGKLDMNLKMLKRFLSVVGSDAAESFREKLDGIKAEIASGVAILVNGTGKTDGDFWEETLRERIVTRG